MGDKSRWRRSTGIEPAIQEYEREVSLEMVREYGLTWADSCGDAEPLTSALRAGQSPTEFVRWWGEKYGLVPVADIDLNSLAGTPREGALRGAATWRRRL